MYKLVETKEIKTEEEGNFSSLFIGKTRKNKENKIPVDSYNRKVHTYSSVLGEVYEKLTGNNPGEKFNALLLNAIGDKNKEVKDWFIKNNQLTKELSKPVELEEAKKNIKGLNKVRGFLNSKFGLGVKILQEL